MRSLALCAFALLAVAHVSAFVSTPLGLRRVSHTPGHLRPVSRAARVRGLQMVETKKAEEKVQQKEMDLCDINSQLCDGQPHTILEAPAAKAEEGKDEKKDSMMTKVKAAGIAGIISYALWEFVFWTVCAPAAVVMYHQTTGEWPSFDNPESTAKVSATIFAFLNVARALVPVRIGLTLATAPLVDKYIVQPFNLKKEQESK